MKSLKILIFLLLPFSVYGQDKIVFLNEDFESGSTPTGWSQQNVRGLVSWKYQDGGYTPNPEIPNSGTPPHAYEGSYNAYFFYSSTNEEATRLISKKIDLSEASKPKLTFWHTQGEYNSRNDQLKIQFGHTPTGPWTTVREFTTPIDSWTQDEYNIPDSMLSADVYIAFEAKTGIGYGVCLDNVEVVETDTIQLFVKDIHGATANTNFVPSGSLFNPILRLDIDIYGNDGSKRLDSLSITSLNTNDDDILGNGVKLFYTTDTLFSRDSMLTSGSRFTNGRITFKDLNLNLQSGLNSLWVTYDVVDSARHGDLLDCKIEPEDIAISDSLYPETEISPAGNRMVRQSIFFDDFETDKGWTLTGDFERDEPQGLGGSSGFSDPTQAFSGDTLLGNDLTGIGSYPGDYENAISKDANEAVSPPINCYYFNDIRLDFYRWLNLEKLDSAFIAVSNDNGTTWHNIWNTDDLYFKNKWELTTYDISGLTNRKKQVRIKFSLGPTDSSAVYSGWNIDDVAVTGNYITQDAAADLWVSPNNGCGLGQEEVSAWVKNNGAEPITSPFDMKYTLDGGTTWVTESFTAVPLIPGDSALFTFSTKADLSTPGIYPSVAIKTALTGDQDETNNMLSHYLYSIPYLTLPYSEDFEANTGVWQPDQVNHLWKYGSPQGFIINSAASGQKAWTTNLNQFYPDLDSAWLQSPCFDFTAAEKPVFDFKINYNLINGEDGVALYYSIDGGNTWLLTDHHSYPWDWNWYNNDTINTLGKGWSGNSDGWIRARQILPDTLAGEHDVKFRLVFKSDSSNIAEGFAFDDVKIYNAPYDVGVISIDSLHTDCQYVNSDLVYVSLKNFGIRPLHTNDTLIIGLDVNSSATVIDTLLVPAEWPVNDTMQFRLTKPVPIGGAGSYTLKAYPLIEADPHFYGNVSNDTASFTFNVLANPVTNLADSVFSAFPDTLILQPVYNAGYEYLWGNGSTDSVFNVPDAGVYTLQVTDTAGNGCITRDTIVIESLVPDIGIDSILYPVSSCELGDSVYVEVQVRNFGTDTITENRQVNVFFTFNNGAVVEDTIILTSDLAPGGTYPYTFTKRPLDMSAITSYQLKAWSYHPYDSIPENDSVASSVQVYGYPTVSVGQDTTVKALTYTLDAGAGYSAYEWEDGSTGQTFVADTSGYHGVTIWDANGCPAKDSAYVFLKIHDVSLTELVQPTTQCEDGNPHYVSVRMVNTGTDTILTGEKIPAAYILNELAVSRDTFTMPLNILPGENRVLTFSKPAVSGGEETYALDIFTELASDLRIQNDTLRDTVFIYNNPVVDLGEDTVIRNTQYTLDAGKYKKEGDTFTYLWNDNSTDSTLDIQNTLNYWVTVTNQHGCQSGDTIKVTFVYPDITATELVSPQTSCDLKAEDLTVKLYNSGTDTLYANDRLPVTYTLNGGEPVTDTAVIAQDFVPGSYLSYTFNQQIDLSTPGSYHLEVYPVFDGDLDHSNDTVQADIDRYGYPQVTLQAEQVIEALEYTLDAGSHENSTYEWQDGSTGQTFTAHETGNYSVIVTDTTGNCQGGDTVYLYFLVNDLSVSNVTMDASVCRGNNYTATVEISNNGNTNPGRGTTLGVGYQVKGEEPITETFKLDKIFPSGTSISHTLGIPVVVQSEESADISFFTYFEPDLVPENDTLVKTVSVKSSPNIDLGGGSDDTLKTTLPYTLDAGEEYAGYLWQDGSANRTFTANDEGWYKVMVTGENGCSTTDSVYIELGTAINSFTAFKGDVNVYPNPAHEMINIEVNTTQFRQIIIEFISPDGKVLYNKKVSGYGDFRESVNVSNYTPGLYYLRIYSKTGVYTRKVIIR